MTAKSVQRRSRLAAAIESVVDGEFATLDEMMTIWGVSKGTLVNTINVIPDFPEVDHVGARNRIFYPRRAALEALQRWEHRGDAVSRDRNARLAAIIGTDPDESADAIPVSEMMKASALRAEVEERMANQGLLVARADMAAISARVLESVSRPLSRLGTVVDPNGRWPLEIRQQADKAGRDILTKIHAELKGILGGNAGRDRQGRDQSSRGATRKAPAPRVSRVGAKGVAKPAGHDPAGNGGDDKRVVKKPQSKRKG